MILKQVSKIILSFFLTALALSHANAENIALDSLKTFVSPDLTFSIPEPNKAKAYSLTGEALFDYLHNATEPKVRVISSYQTSKSYMYSTADNTGCNGQSGIITAYSDVCINGSGGDGNSYKEHGDTNDDGISGDFINAEHIWPQSFFNSQLPMVADIHQLMSTLSVPNGRRANLKFCEVLETPLYKTSSGSKLGKSCFEPGNSVKGNVARAIFYFIVRYSDQNIRQGGMNYKEFWTDNVSMFMKWNRQDPPDANEKRRNNLIEKFQGNRNPFIDDPSLVDAIGETVFESH